MNNLILLMVGIFVAVTMLSVGLSGVLIQQANANANAIADGGNGNVLNPGNRIQIQQQDQCGNESTCMSDSGQITIRDGDVE